MIGVDTDGRPFACLDGAPEETKTVAGLDVAEEVRGSQVCAPEEEPATDEVDVGGWEARCWSAHGHPGRVIMISGRWGLDIVRINIAEMRNENLQNGTALEVEEGKNQAAAGILGRRTSPIIGGQTL